MLAVLAFISMGAVACTSQRESFSQTSVKTAGLGQETIDINTASAEELTQIPFVGEKLALTITEHRRIHGPFRRIEELMLLDGISDRRFREIRHRLRVN